MFAFPEVSHHPILLVVDNETAEIAGELESVAALQLLVRIH
jgi:hypothetical protein